MPGALETGTTIGAPTSRARQWRMLGIVVGIAVAILVALRVAAAMKPADPVPPPPERGVLRVTADQYAGLKVMTVGGGGVAAGARASGVIAVDDNHSTPVLPPLTGQVTKIFVQPGQRVVEGQPLLRIRAPEFVDNRNTLLVATAQRQTAQSQLKVAEAAAQRAEAIYRDRKSVV